MTSSSKGRRRKSRRSFLSKRLPTASRFRSGWFPVRIAHCVSGPQSIGNQNERNAGRRSLEKEASGHTSSAWESRTHVAANWRRSVGVCLRFPDGRQRFWNVRWYYWAAPNKKQVESLEKAQEQYSVDVESESRCRGQDAPTSSALHDLSVCCQRILARSAFWGMGAVKQIPPH